MNQDKYLCDTEGKLEDTVDAPGGMNVYHVELWEIGVVIWNSDDSEKYVDNTVYEGHRVEASSEQDAIQQTVEYYRESEWDLVRFRYIKKNLAPMGGRGE